jgi:hypothetical protein
MKVHTVPKGTMSQKALTPTFDNKTVIKRTNGRPYNTKAYARVIGLPKYRLQ